MEFSLFYFAADAAGGDRNRYRLLLDGARFADQHGFAAVWTPERHFHEFGASTRTRRSRARPSPP